MDWEKENLEREFKRFKHHCNFIFEGPLADKTEKVKGNYLMSFMGDKGRDIFETLDWAPEVAAVIENDVEVQARVPAEKDIIGNI